MGCVNQGTSCELGQKPNFGSQSISISQEYFEQDYGKRSSGIKPKTLIETFYYPELGSGQIYETIKEQVLQAGHHIFFNSYPTRIIHDNNHIVAANVRNNDENFEIKFDYLIESIHIVDFLKLLYPPPPEYVTDAAKRLQYRSQVYLFVTLDRNKVTDDQWIYFPDPNTPFARISEMKNFSRKMSPTNKTSIFVEFFCNEDYKLYQLTKEELFELCVPYLEKYGFFNRNDIRHYYKFQGHKDYPIYNVTYETNLNIIKNYLDSFDNLFYIGRPGRFEYTSQDQSIEMGIQSSTEDN